MKHYAAITFLFLALLLFGACSKDDFITSPDAIVRTSADTLHFDTVFTTTGSVTQSFKIFNSNDNRLLLSEVTLAGGATSFFKINLNGVPGTSFSNVEIAARDSIYLFVTVSINPNAANLPFLVQDSLLIAYNGNKKFVQLEAFGQNAVFLNRQRVVNDTTWNNTLPVVVLGSFTVPANRTLTISPGTKVYFHADAPLLVAGSLRVNGTLANKVIFRGDRLDERYRDLPASWPGIIFGSSSRDNVLANTEIRNAYQALVVDQPASNANPKLSLTNCIIDNAYDAGILAANTSIYAANCQVTNCGVNVALQSGGSYTFIHSTIAGYANSYIRHANPSLYLSNSDVYGATNSLSAAFTNCIVYGQGVTEDEVASVKQGTAGYAVTFNNVLYKVKAADPDNVVLNNCIRNQDPQFDSIGVNTNYYNFMLRASSPAINKGRATVVTTDLNGKQRGSQPDLGCYEY